MGAPKTGNVRNVVLVGQGGVGKTSLAEAMLHLSGKTARLGGHDGTKPTLDYDPEEVKRSFSISTTIAPIDWKGARINVLDAPCYPDFIGDAFAAMSVCETALFVVDAEAGPQPTTVKLWYAAEDLRLARAVFVNRLSRSEASFATTMDLLQERFGTRLGAVTLPRGEGEDFDGIIDLVRMKARHCNGTEAVESEIPEEYRAQAEEAHDHLCELVAEADESDGSFAKYHPQIAIITNSEADHLDHYGTQDNYRAAFVDHAGHATKAVIMCGDDEGNLAVLRALDATVAGRTIVYSTRNAAELGDLNGATLVRIESESETAESGAEHFTLHIPGGLIGEEERRIAVTLTVPGIHNARNASAAIIAAALLGMDVERASAAVTSFLGAARRFQVRGTVSQVTVVDDYAHHPTEIAALLDAARRRYPQSKIRVIFQPHLFSRTRFFSSEFAQALAKADDVIVTGIFPAREKQEDFPDVTPATIVDEALKLEHEPAKDWIRGVEDMHTAAQMMVMRAHHGDVIFTVGAGDITQMDEVILHALEAHRWDCEG